MIKGDEKVLQALRETGLPWAIEPGHGHNKIRLCGRLVGVMGARKNGSGPRANRNVIQQIRRAAAGQSGGET